MERVSHTVSKNTRLKFSESIFLQKKFENIICFQIGTEIIVYVVLIIDLRLFSRINRKLSL